MAWQIQCKQHFLKQLDTLNNQIESEKTLNWHEDVQMYYWDCMRERGSERSNVLLLNMYESLWVSVRVVERGSLIQVAEGVRVVWCSQNILWYIWELCESFLLLVQYSLNTSQNRQNMDMGLREVFIAS